MFRLSLKIAAALLLLCVVPAGCQATSLPARPPADLIVTNARVHTMDERQPLANALAVQEGRFVAVGDAAAIDAWRGPDTRLVDARGACIIPGLNDSHAHAVRGDASTTSSCAGTESARSREHST